MIRIDKTLSDCYILLGKAKNIQDSCFAWFHSNKPTQNHTIVMCPSAASIDARCPLVENSQPHAPGRRLRKCWAARFYPRKWVTLFLPPLLLCRVQWKRQRIKKNPCKYKQRVVFEFEENLCEVQSFARTKCAKVELFGVERISHGGKKALLWATVEVQFTFGSLEKQNTLEDKEKHFQGLQKR